MRRTVPTRRILPCNVLLCGTYVGSVPYLMIDMYARGYRGARVRRKPGVGGCYQEKLRPVYATCGMR